MMDAAASHLADVCGYEVRILPNRHPTRREIEGRYPSSRIGKLADAAAEVIRADFVGFIGADILDGVYNPEQVLIRLRLLRLARLTGATTRVFGSSFSTTPCPRIVSTLKRDRKLEIYARDPVSLKRITAATGRTAKLVADLAFLLHPEMTSAAAHRASDWIDGQRRAGRTILGANVNGMIARADDGAARTAGSVARALSDWLGASPERAILLLPHDLRESVGDVDCLAQVFASMPVALRDRMHLIEAPIHAWDAKALAGRLDFVVTGRMHFAIAALGMGVPPLCIVYQGKFEGLMQHFGLKGMTMEPSVCLMPGDLLAAVERVGSDLPPLRATIARALPDVHALSRANFDGL